MGANQPPAVELAPAQPIRDRPVATAARERAGFLWPQGHVPGWRHSLLRRMLALADVGAVLAASVSPIFASGDLSAQVVWSLVFVPAWIVVAKLLGLYDHESRSLRQLTIDEAPRIVLWALVGTSLLAAFLKMTTDSWLTPSSAVLVGFVAAFSALVLRATSRRLWRWKTPPERVAIVGPPESRATVRRTLKLLPDLHMVPVDERDVLGYANGDGLWLGAIDRLILAPDPLGESQTREAIEMARASRVALTVVPPWQGVVGAAARLEHVAGLPILAYPTNSPSRSTLFLKRVVDLVTCSIAALVLLPLFVLVSVAIKLDSRGPVLFRQERIGRGGTPFVILKFRTMGVDAEAHKANVAHLNRHAGVDPRMFKAVDDPRVTRVGRVLRRFSIDELPQLINVVRGEMSLVGPRPLIPEEDRFVPQWARVRSAVPPGITGPWQVNGASALPFSAMIELDFRYVTNMSLRRDVEYIARTLPALLGRLPS